MQVNSEPAARRNSTSERLKPAPVFTRPVTFHYEIQNHTTRMQKLTKAFQVYRLMALTVICVLAGIIIGLLCRPKAKSWTERQFMYVEFPGELYLRFLKLMIIPLLVSNVILSFGTIQAKISSRLAKVAGILYLASNFLAIFMAIVIATIMCPGGMGQSLSLQSNTNANSINNNNNNNNNNNDNNINQNTHNYFNFGNFKPHQQLHHHHHNHQQQQQQQSSGNSDPNSDPNSSHHNLFQQHDQHDSIARYREYHPMFYHTNSDKQPAPGQLKRLVQLAAAMERRDKEWARRHERAISSASGDRDPPLGNQNKEARTSPGLMVKDEANLLARSIKKSTNSPVRTDTGRIGLGTKLPIDVVLDALRNLIPDSLVGAALQQSRTRLFTPKELRVDRNGTTDPPPNKWLMGHELIQQPNIIGLLAMSVMTGVVLSHMGEASKPLLDLCSCVSELSLRIGMKAIHTAPFCIMFLLISQIARARDLSLMAGELLMYALTVILALSVHGAIILPLFYYLVTKKSPLIFFKGLIQALVASFATSSSSATMALVLNCLSELNLNLIIVRAFGPLGSVFNMNGTSIFESVAVIFIAQILGLKLSFTSLLLIGFCSAIASLSTSGIPSSGMMTMVIVLNAINLPVLELSIIYIVDFIIDRFRTVINVWSGAIVCGLIDHICPEELFEEEMKPEKYREMVKYRGSRTSLSGRKSCQVDDKPQVISVTITPPPNENNRNS